MNITAAPANTRLDLDMAGTLMTPEEFDAIDDYNELYRYELIHGVLVVNPIPLEGEVGPNEMLGHWLLRFKEEHPRGSILDGTLPERYVRTCDSRRRADRLIWVGLGRRPNPKVDLPTIVIEFVSRARRDRQRDYIEKRSEYLQLGIAEYWVIDRFQRIMTVFRQSEPNEFVVNEHEIYQSDLLPGFELPLAELLAVADAWEAVE